MNLTETEEDKKFREEVKAFLESALSPELVRAGENTTSIFSDFDAAIAWQKILHDKGWLLSNWPVEHGGNGWTLAQKTIFETECKKHNAPALFSLGIQMLGPIIIKYGTDEQKDLYLERIASTEDIWCQGYSEPNAGSDLAALKTSAKREGKDYIVNGSKIWTSYAHRSNMIFCLVRTSTEGPKQAGISFLLIDMNTPGVQVDEIISIDGEVEQCQVFFDDVRVPAANLVGEENQGWEISKYLLQLERGGYSYFNALNKSILKLRKIAEHQLCDNGSKMIDDPVFADKLANLEMEKLALEFTEHRVRLDENIFRENPAISSVPKLVGTELGQKLDLLGLELRNGYTAPLQNHALSPQYEGDVIGDAHGIALTNSYLNNRASTIYGGSAQVQRNIIAKQLMKS